VQKMSAQATTLYCSIVCITVTMKQVFLFKFYRIRIISSSPIFGKGSFNAWT